MKKILTLLTFVFMTSAMLFGQCADFATPNGNGRFFNMNYDTQASRDAALVGLVSVTFPTAGGGTITVALGDLVIDGPVGAGTYRIRADEGAGTFDGSQNGNFAGDIIFNYAGSSTTCTYTGSVLPVELISFDGVMKDHQIDLTWETASEINNEGFLVERGVKTTSGIEWNQLDFINGNGSTTVSQSYSYIDRNPEEGTNYYRLKQMDYDGEYEYSSVIAVEYSKGNSDTSIDIFPNPAKDQLTLVNGKGKATIYNVLGQPVKQFIIDANQFTIQLADLLVDGQYYIQVLKEDGTTVTKKFSKVD